MCSVFDGMLQPNFHQADLRTDFQGLSEGCAAFTFVARLMAYIAVIALLVLIMLVILKYLSEPDDDQTPEEHFHFRFQLQSAPATETTPLQSDKCIHATYNTSDGGQDGDIESGSGSTISSSSSEELYDGKICVICYDEERNCFFVPCGHCATCYDCAERIFEGDSRVCPVCRRLIRKVKKWFVS